jgi:hypothetical protein
MAIGALSLLTSRITEQRAQFAKRRTGNRRRCHENTAKFWPVNGKVTPISDMEAEQHLGAAGREALRKLRAEQEGPPFDRLYSQGQTEGHHKLLRLQESYLDSGRNRYALQFARLVANRERLAALGAPAGRLTDLAIGPRAEGRTSGLRPRPKRASARGRAWIRAVANITPRVAFRAERPRQARLL